MAHSPNFYRLPLQPGPHYQTNLGHSITVLNPFETFYSRPTAGLIHAAVAASLSIKARSALHYPSSNPQIVWFWARILRGRSKRFKSHRVFISGAPTSVELSHAQNQSQQSPPPGLLQSGHHSEVSGQELQCKYELMWLVPYRVGSCES